jgi:hypothetical protein
MIPRIAKRGHSFKGAGLYYLHDKESKSNERVEWTHTHNLPTDDPKKAMGWMAYTAKNADRLKDQAGVVKTGRKSTSGAVYSYSLSWHPEEKPTREVMQESAMTVLQRLGLSDHEAVFVAHNDTEHPHVHVICNVVHPETGKLVAPSYDYLTTSNWAEKLEKDNGKIYCEQRVINNERRRAEAKQDRQLALVKHREARSERAKLIEQLFLQSKNGKDFQTAIQDEGYTLSKGDRRGFVLVDEHGKVHSLSRQIKSLKAKEIQEKISDVEDVRNAQELLKAQAQSRKDTQLVEKNEPTSNTTTDELEPSRLSSQNNTPQEQSVSLTFNQKIPNHEISKNGESHQYDEFRSNIEENEFNLEHLDKLRDWEQKTERRKQLLTHRLNDYYSLNELNSRIEELKLEMVNKNNWWARVSGKRDSIIQELEMLESNLSNINERIKEQYNAFDIRAQSNRPSIRNEHRKEVEQGLKQSDHERGISQNSCYNYEIER